MTLGTGLRIRNRTTLRLKDQSNSDWEVFHQNGTMRNVFTNELKRRSDIPDLVIKGEEFPPGSVEGVVGEQDELDGTWTVQWFHPQGHPISSSHIEGSTWYKASEIDSTP